tara:strand:+ start:126 stop:245 length:120 start_codon:yes stop_codon:yes gene_type:complete
MRHPRDTKNNNFSQKVFPTFEKKSEKKKAKKKKRALKDK